MKLQQPFRTALIATLGVGVGILLITSVQTLSTILLYVGTALFLALGLDPAVSWLERRGLPRWAALLITFAAVLAVFAGIILIVIPVLVGQISQLVTQLQKLVQSAVDGDWNPVDALSDWLHSVFPALDVDKVFTAISQWYESLDLGQIGGAATGAVLSIGAGIVAGFTGAIIVLILTIYFTASTPSLKASVYQLVPASKRARFIDLSEQITASVGYYVMGQVSLGVINGILSAIFLTIIQAPFPAVLAVVAFFFSLIPLVGTLTGSAIIILVCLTPGLGPLPAHHEPRRLGARRRRRDRGSRRRVAPGPAGRAHRDPGRREHPDHLPPGDHPEAERAVTGRARRGSVSPRTTPSAAAERRG